jgi:hypothetical protein
MSTYRADPKQWADIERWADQTESASDACFLELRSRIELLEKRIEVQLDQLSDLQSRHSRLFLDVNRLTNDVMALQDQQVNDLESPDSSLLLRIQKAIAPANVIPGKHWFKNEARAALNEVASWLESQEDAISGFQRVAKVLKREAQQ